MKKVFLLLALVIAVPCLFLFWLFHERTYHVKTDFGDSFTICGGGITEDYCLRDDNSDSIMPLLAYNGKNDIQSIEDSDCLRCYKIQNNKENSYLLKLKRYDKYVVISASDKEYTEYEIKGKSGEMVKSELLCDSILMGITLPYLDRVYHDEMTDIAKKLVKHDFEGLDKYGLTEEMINNKESLEEKIGIMEEYLKENSIQPETASSEK